MIRLQEIKQDIKHKYWFYPLHNRRIKLFTTDKNLKRHKKLNNFEMPQSHIIKTHRSIDYLFFEL